MIINQNKYQNLSWSCWFAVLSRQCTVELSLLVEVLELGEWHFTFYIYVYSRYKGIPTTGHEGPRGIQMQWSTYSQPRRQEEVGWLALHLTVFTPVLILQETEWTPGPVWIKSSEKYATIRHPGSNRGRPAHSQTPCRLSSLDLGTKYRLPILVTFHSDVFTHLELSWRFLELLTPDVEYSTLSST